MLGVNVLLLDDGSDAYHPGYTGLSERPSSESIADSRDIGSLEDLGCSYDMADSHDGNVPPTPPEDVGEEGSGINDDISVDTSELEPILYGCTTRDFSMGIFRRPEFARGVPEPAVLTELGSDSELALERGNGLRSANDEETPQVSRESVSIILPLLSGNDTATAPTITADKHDLSDASEVEEITKESIKIDLPPLVVDSASTIHANASPRHSRAFSMYSPDSLQIPKRSTSQVKSRRITESESPKTLSAGGSSTISRVEKLSSNESPLSCRLSYEDAQKGIPVSDVEHWIMNASYRRNTIPKTAKEERSEHLRIHGVNWQHGARSVHSVGRTRHSSTHQSSTLQSSTVRTRQSYDSSSSALLLPFMTMSPSPLMTRRMTLWPRQDVRHGWRQFSQPSSSHRSTHHSTRSHKEAVIPVVMSHRLPLLQHEPHVRRSHRISQRVA